MEETIELKATGFSRDVTDYMLNGVVWKVPYIKYGLEKVVDWKREEVWSQNTNIGTALISAIKQDRFNECQLKPVNDKVTGIRIGWGGGGIDAGTGMPKLGSYKIDQLTMELNLSVPEQQKLYFFIATNPMVIGSPNCWVQKNAMLEIVDKNADAQKNIELRNLRFNAMTKAKEIQDIDQIRDLVTVFEETPNGIPDAQLKDMFEDYADKQPKQFMALMTSKDRPYLITYSKAKAMSIIQFDLEHGEMFGQVRLGLNKEEVVEYLKKNSEMYKHIDNAITKEENSATNSMGDKLSQLPPENQDKALLNENARLKQKMLDSESRLAKLEQMLLDQAEAKKEETAIPVGETTVIETEEVPLEEMKHKELTAHCIANAYPQGEWNKLRATKDLLAYVKEKESGNTIDPLI